MPISPYLSALRSKIGHGLLVVPSASGLVLNENGQVLLVKRSANRRWTVPGGITDPNESPAMTVVREVFEETGILVRPLKILGVFGARDGFRTRYPNGDEVEFVDVLFHCAPVGGLLKPRDGEICDAQYAMASPEIMGDLEYPADINAILRSHAVCFGWHEDWIQEATGGK